MQIYFFANMKYNAYANILIIVNCSTGKKAKSSDNEVNIDVVLNKQVKGLKLKNIV